MRKIEVRMCQPKRLFPSLWRPRTTPVSPSVHTRSTLFVDVTLQYDETERIPWVTRFVSHKVRITKPLFSNPSVPLSWSNRIRLGGVTNTVSSPNDQGHHRPRLTS